MALQFRPFQSDRYQIETDVYQGPLDLLLELIEKAELDITVLSLAQVTDQFLETVKQMEEDDPSEVSAFIVIAARLILIKSRALLPQPPGVISDLDEDSGEDLAQQLILYRRFKQLAGWLYQREDIHFQSYERLSAPNLDFEPPLDLSNFSLERLQQLAAELFAREAEKPALSTILSQPRITIGHRIMALTQKLKQRGKTSLFSMLSGDRIETVVTFLAMLELIKRNLVDIRQDDLFGDIEIVARETLAAETDIQSEFGD
ncbi:MAG: segregation/condensation protein A [Chloroflexi bacterium]|nr:segregation/condensation protein A [Chloroflexota bacterium]